MTHCKTSSTSTSCCGGKSYNYNTQICCYRYSYVTQLSEVSETGKDESDKDESDNDKSFTPLSDEESDITQAPVADELKPEDKSFNTDDQPHDSAAKPGDAKHVKTSSDQEPDVTKAAASAEENPDGDKSSSTDNPAPKTDDDEP